jgi:epsilon-lactone hydrolase
MVRMIVKHWAKGDPPAVVRRARRVFGLPNFASLLQSRGIAIEQVDTVAPAESGIAAKRGAEKPLAEKIGADQAGYCRIRGEWIRPLAGSDSGNVILYLHGGGYVSCTPQTHRPITASLARMARCRVFSLDYRLAPEHPFPAAVDDAAVAFRWLVANGVSANKIAVAGDSAGGGLVLATMLRLRSSGVALPACGVCLSPWVDLTGADKYQNSGSCSMFQPADVATFALLYLNGAPAETAEASPLFADLGGLPPLLTQVSSTELLMDDAVRLHEKAGRSGVASTLSIYPGLPHVWQIFTPLIPEAKTAFAEIASFVGKAWEGAAGKARNIVPEQTEKESRGEEGLQPEGPAVRRTIKMCDREKEVGHGPDPHPA